MEPQAENSPWRPSSNITLGMIITADCGLAHLDLNPIMASVYEFKGISPQSPAARKPYVGVACHLRQIVRRTLPLEELKEQPATAYAGTSQTETTFPSSTLRDHPRELT
jgi:hypothetical protein